LRPAGLVDQHDLGSDHEVSIYRRDYAVFKFEKMIHARLVRRSLGWVNRKLYFATLSLLSGARRLSFDGLRVFSSSVHQ
jgi:hypothetical protein